MTDLTKTLSAITAEIDGRGNGLPIVGDYVPADDGNLYRVAAIISRETSQRLIAIVTVAPWNSCSDDDWFPAATRIL
jgi:hypothetical protein